MEIKKFREKEREREEGEETRETSFILLYIPRY